MFNNRSKFLFASSILATIYAIYFTVAYYSYFEYFLEVWDLFRDSNISEVMIPNLIIPVFVIFLYLGTLFSWVGFFVRSHKLSYFGSVMLLLAPISILGFSLYFLNYGKVYFSAIFAIIIALFVSKFIICIPMIILTFVGSSNQKNIWRRENGRA